MVKNEAKGKRWEEESNIMRNSITSSVHAGPLRHQFSFR